MNSKIIKQRDYKAPNFVLQAVNLDFFLKENNTYVKNIMKFTNIIGDICLDGIDLELISISLNKKILKPKEYIKKEKEIVIFSPPKNCTIEIITNINPIQNSRLEGLYISDEIFVTQCEAQGFRRITYFLKLNIWYTLFFENFRCKFKNASINKKQYYLRLD